jgi:hypothetical protein
MEHKSGWRRRLGLVIHQNRNLGREAVDTNRLGLDHASKITWEAVDANIETTKGSSRKQERNRV